MPTRPMDAPHDMLLPGTRTELTRELFCRSLTNYLETRSRPSLRALYEQEVAPGLRARLGREPGRREIAAAMREQPRNRMWYAMRSASQRMSYEASAAVIARQRPELEARAARTTGAAGGTLALDPAVQVPRYIAKLDIHLMPGGYAAENGPADLAAGALFDRQMTLNRHGSQGVLNEDPGRSLAAWLKARFPQFAPRRILELGCTVGHALLPFAEFYPEAELHAIDVAAPCLRYAHARAEALGIRAHFAQRDAEATGFDDGSFDLVISNILFHETNAARLPQILRECRRVLRPGGAMLHVDVATQPSRLPFADQVMNDWQVRWNGEPFWTAFAECDMRREIVAAGFDPDRSFAEHVPRPGGAWYVFGAAA